MVNDLIADLTEKFGPALDVKPWGSCIVVQGTEFDPDWEAELADQGFKCHFGTLDAHAVTFVQLKKIVAPGKTVYVPPVAPKNVPGNEVKEMEKKQENKKQGSNRWTSEDEKLLVEVIGGATYGKNRLVEKALREGKFPGRNVGGCVQKYDKMPKTSKEAKKIPAFIEPADPDDNQAFMENAEKPKWNGEFAEKCNLQHACIDCDLTECPGRKSEGLQKSKIEDTDVLLDLVGKVQVLSEAYESLSRGYLELRTKIEDISQDVEKTLGNFANEMPSNEDLAAVRKDLSVHEHVKSGKVFLPMEVS